MIRIESNWDEDPMQLEKYLASDWYKQNKAESDALEAAEKAGYIHEFEHGDLYLWLRKPLSEYSPRQAWATAFDPVAAEYFTVNLHALRSLKGQSHV